MKTSTQMGHKYIVGPPWINGKPGCDSLDGTQDNMWSKHLEILANKTICGENVWKYWYVRKTLCEIDGHSKEIGDIGTQDNMWNKCCRNIFQFFLESGK